MTTKHKITIAEGLTLYSDSGVYILEVISPS